MRCLFVCVFSHNVVWLPIPVTFPTPGTALSFYYTFNCLPSHSDTSSASHPAPFIPSPIAPCICLSLLLARRLFPLFLGICIFSLLLLLSSIPPYLLLSISALPPSWSPHLLPSCLHCILPLSFSISHVTVTLLIILSHSQDTCAPLQTGMEDYCRYQEKVPTILRVACTSITDGA